MTNSKYVTNRDRNDDDDVDVDYGDDHDDPNDDDDDDCHVLNTDQTRKADYHEKLKLINCNQHSSDIKLLFLIVSNSNRKLYQLECVCDNYKFDGNFSLIILLHGSMIVVVF